MRICQTIKIKSWDIVNILGCHQSVTVALAHLDLQIEMLFPLFVLMLQLLKLKLVLRVV